MYGLPRWASTRRHRRAGEGSQGIIPSGVASLSSNISILSSAARSRPTSDSKSIDSKEGEKEEVEEEEEEEEEKEGEGEGRDNHQSACFDFILFDLM